MLEATLHRRVEMKRSVIAAFALLAATSPLGAQTPRPLTFLDAQNMRQASGAELSPDGRSMLYTLSVPDWNAARRQSDVYMVSLDRGLPSTRQLTFTKDKNETSPKWSNDGSFIAFVSDRDATGAAPAGGAGGGRGGGRGGEAGGRNQLFVMRLDGGEAKRVTDAREGVSTFTFSKDGKTIVYASGRSDNEQIYALTIADLWQGDFRMRRSGRVMRQASTPGSGRPTARRSTSSRPTASTATNAHAWTSSSRFVRAIPRRRSRACGSSTSRPNRRRSSSETRRTALPTSASHPTENGSVIAACRRTATSAASSSRATTPICICWRSQRGRSSGSRRTTSSPKAASASLPTAASWLSRRRMISSFNISPRYMFVLSISRMPRGASSVARPIWTCAWAGGGVAAVATPGSRRDSGRRKATRSTSTPASRRRRSCSRSPSQPTR